MTAATDLIGRDRWSGSLTIVLRDKALVIAGITSASRDTLDPKAGHRCDLNLVTGKGTLDGRPYPGKLAPIPLADGSDEKMPKGCRG